MSSIFVDQALIEAGMPDADTKITDDVFGRLTFKPNVWTKTVSISYFGINHSVPIFIHTTDGSINSIQKDCYTEFMNDIEGTLDEYKSVFKTGSKIDCLIFQLDSLVVVLTGKTDDDYMVLEFEA